MSLKRVLNILLISLLAAFAIGCDSSNDDDYSLNQSYQNFDAPVRLKFLTVPQRAAGSPFGTIQVGILDHNGKIVTTANNPVTIALKNPAGATLSGTTTVNAVAGVAAFSGLTIDREGQYAFTATSPDLLPADSDDFVVIPGAPATATFLIQPPPLPTPGTNPGPGTSVIKGQPFATPLQVELRDASGNLLNTNSTVNIVIANDPTGTATLGGRTAVPAVNGVATFTDLTVETGGGVLVLAAVSGDALVVSDPFFVNANLFAYVAATIPGAPFGPDSELFRADVLAATVTPLPVGQITGVKNVAGLVPLRNGRLLGATNDGGVAKVFTIVDPTISATPSTPAPIAGANGGTVTGLTYDGSANVVYAYISGGTSPGLYTLNPITGTATFVGASGLSGTGVGLALDPFQNPRVLYTGRSGSNSLVTLDPATGVGTEVPTSVGNLSSDVSGLLINPFNTVLSALNPVAATLVDISKTTAQPLGTPALSLPFVTSGTLRVEE